jgi:predicted GNAT family acetyltransferase
MLADTQRLLDNPVWSCPRRATRISRWGSHRAPLSARHFADYGFPDTGAADIAALESLVEVGDDMGAVGPCVPALRSNWETLVEMPITQMVRDQRTPLPEGDVDVSALGETDVADMLALVEVTQPGPFRLRTIDLGCFIGVRDNGRLLAMAGERMWIGDCREVSGVCTHPDAQGRGYARALTGRVVNRMLDNGQLPILHGRVATAARSTCTKGSALSRTEFPLLHARRRA